MFVTRKDTIHEPSAYATRSDFCRIFKKDMNSLYLLSFLLTADHSIAEQCFVGGLHVAQQGNPVFKEWAETWAKRAIIMNAIRMIRPRLTADRTADTKVAVDEAGADNLFTEQPEIARIVDLPTFERFAFVMTVLERYSDQECSLHLRCTRRDIAAARKRALQNMGRSIELHRPLVSAASSVKTQRGERAIQPGLAMLSSLPVSA